MSVMMDGDLPEAFPLHALETVRYADLDRQGHVNNAVFATFLEAGRVAMIYSVDAPLAEAGTSFVIARLAVDFRAEITWPGEVLIGTRVLETGTSSFRLKQALFQFGRCVATAQSVIVLVDELTRRSRPLPALARARLAALTAARAAGG